MNVGQVGLYQDHCVYGLISRNMFKILNGIYLSYSKKNLNVIVNEDFSYIQVFVC